MGCSDVKPMLNHPSFPQFLHTHLLPSLWGKPSVQETIVSIVRRTGNKMAEMSYFTKKSSPQNSSWDLESISHLIDDSKNMSPPRTILFSNTQICYLFHLNLKMYSERDAGVRVGNVACFQQWFIPRNFKIETFVPLYCRLVSRDDKNSHLCVWCCLYSCFVS